MSFVKRTVHIYQKAENLFKSKSFQNYALFSLTFFLMLGFFLNTYSASANFRFEYDPVEYYQHSDELSTASTGTEGKHSHKSQSFQMMDFTTNMLDVFYPPANANYSSILENPNISPGAKMGVVGAVDMPVTAMLHNPPNVDVAEHLAQEWIPNYDQTGGVYADSGYQMLLGTPIVSELWSVTRNIAYMLFVIVFIIAGFMIMFRHKLQGQTMVTVYNTLPNVVVGLILVTFSFAIVGFMLDIGALLIRVVAGVLGLSLDQAVSATDPFDLMSTYMVDVMGSGIIEAFTDNILALVSGLLFLFMGSLIALLIALAVIAVIVWMSIKIFFTLIKAYIGIIFDTIAAPLVFAISTVPGQRSVMKDWFNRVAKNIMVFVLVFTLINLPIYLMEQGGTEGYSMFGGDLSGSGSSVGQFGGSIIMMGLALYLLFLASNCAKMLEDYFPQGGGKGAQAAADGAKADMGKIPLVGGFFKG